MTNSFLQALGFAVLSSLWQAAILFALFLLAKWSNRKSTAELEATLSQIFLAIIVLLFASSIVYYYFSSSEGATLLWVVSEPVRNTVQKWVSTGYILFLLIPLAQGIRSYFYVHYILHNGLTKAPYELRFFTQKIKTQLGITRQVALFISTKVISPVTINIAKPVILLPISAITHLSESQVEALLIHELHHIKRYDFAINIFVKCAQGLLYFNPFVHAFARIIEQGREQACDNMVLHYSYNPIQYAEALLELKKNSLQKMPVFVLSALGSGKNSLLKRVQHILGVQVQSQAPYHLKQWAGFSILLGATLLLCISFTTGGVQYTNSKKLYVEKILNTYPAITSIHKATATTETKHSLQSIRVQVNNKLSQTATTITIDDLPETIEMPTSWAIYKANHVSAISAPLSPDKENEIDRTINSSKKIIETRQEKEIDLKAADALNKDEKTILKEQAKQMIDNMAWENMRQNLRNRYNEIQWNVVNEMLDARITRIRMDSLCNAWTMANEQLCELTNEMRTHNVKAIPDTDITLVSLETKQQQVMEALNKLKINLQQPKKVIHL